MQIKDDKQLLHLTQSVEIMSEKRDKFEKDRIEKEKLINSLKQEVNFLNERVESLEKASDDHEQYFRRNCLLIHGIEEVIGSESQVQEKKRPRIVKFVQYNDRHKAYSNKK